MEYIAKEIKSIIYIILRWTYSFTILFYPFVLSVAVNFDERKQQDQFHNTVLIMADDFGFLDMVFMVAKRKFPN